MTIERGGFDVWFTIPGLDDGDFIDIISNTNITTGSSPENTIARVRRSGSAYSIYVVDANEVIYQGFVTSVSSPKKIRWCMHNNFLSCYVNENWIHTFYFPNIEYPEHEDFLLFIKSVGKSIDITDVKVVDLYDWREAIYIDLDSVAANAISSVIQQRPVELCPTYLGEVKFQYSVDEKRSIVNLYQKLITSCQKTNNPNAVISDAIVYGPEVEILTSENTASLHGFITRIIRVPELDMGSRRAAKELIKLAEQQSIIYTIILRSDIRIEMGDILQCSYTLSGTGTVIPISCIVETMSLNQKNAVFQMTITGRNYVS
jgi:hypothetical protein